MHQEYSDILDTMTAQIREAHFWIKKDGDGPAPSCADEIDSETEECHCVAKPLWYDEHGVPRFTTHHPDLCPDIYADEVALVRIACQACAHGFLVQMSRGKYELAALLAMAGTHGTIPRLLDEALKIGLALDSLTEFPLSASRLKGIAAELVELRKYKPPNLAEQIMSGVIHYGDVPNVGCCPAGPTMSCDDLQVVEFWRKGRGPIGPTTLGNVYNVKDPVYGAVGDGVTDDTAAIQAATDAANAAGGGVVATMEAMGWARVPDLEIELPDAKEHT